MKNESKVLGITVFMVIGFAVLLLTACSNGGENGELNPNIGSDGSDISSHPGHDHQWGEWGETTAPTCAEVGIETRVCTFDATHTETRDGAAALGHQYGLWVETTAPTYMAEGIDTRTCSRDTMHKETRTVLRRAFTTFGAFRTWLSAQPNNTRQNPYIVKINAISIDSADANNTYLSGSKYVYLDLSGSTMTSISGASSGFKQCEGITGVIIPNSVTFVGNETFNDCSNLTSVTFLGTFIKAKDQYAITGFYAYNTFPGNLFERFFDIDPLNGTPGTYTRASTSSSAAWTRQ
jgi:hypothetical protein